ncbi:MAG: AAA family ATPase [Fibrobacter sp.]|uniref:AAA family ATPase n=1 Tax=Fibrobacter sp. TaxID=35828 RepID=UPI001B13B42C|nr:AAA family ATPase [Fibrobacter sp.]MBO7060573.1 AAA family ATPase [Fibrobacter sp.]
MKLSIKNFGPVKQAVVDFKRINVLVGPQSSGKSTILKIASFCNWVEKNVQLTQAPGDWVNPDIVRYHLILFHKLDGYALPGSEISYKSDTLQFDIKFDKNLLIGTHFEWTKKRWNYRRTKNTYIPAERNIVASIPNWLDVNFDKFNNIRNYMAEWDVARRNFDNRHKLDILNMGVSYFYDDADKSDHVALNGKKLKFSNASSGLQSLVPQYALLSYLFDISLMSEPASLRKMQTDLKLKDIIEQDPKLKKLGIADNYLKNCGVKVFLEEPEQNLFPKAQYGLVKWFAQKLNGNPHNSLFVSTHSPYILSSLNNLIQAHDSAAKGDAARRSAEKIVGQKDFVDFDDVRVYGVSNGRVKNLMDKESRLIAQSFLDSASLDISNEFSRLLDL